MLMKTKITLHLIILLISNFAIGQWTAVNNGLPAITSRGIAKVNNKLFTAISGHGIYYSDDLGLSWKIWGRSSEITGTNYHRIIGHDFDLSGQGSVFFSLSGDNTIAYFEDQPSNANSLSNVPLTGLSGNALQVKSWMKNDGQNIFLAGTASGFYYTPNIGTTPLTLAAGLPNNIKINTCQLTGDSNEFTFVGTDSGLYRSLDNGKNFTANNTFGLANPLRINYMSGLFTLTERGIYLFKKNSNTFDELTNSGVNRTQNIGDYKAYTYNPSNGKIYFFGNNIGSSLNLSGPIQLDNFSLNGIVDKDIIGTTVTDEYLFVSTVTSGIYRIKISTLGVTDFKNLNQKKFNVWPNPSNGQFTISSNDATSIQLFDINGKLIQTYSVDQDKEIKTTLESGIYLLKDAQKGEIQKLIIK